MDKIAWKLQDHYDILDFLNKNYPSILKEWKLGIGPGTTEPNTNSTDDSNHSRSNQNGNYRDK